MLFSSVTFLFYFLPITLLGYFVLKFSLKAQNIWLLVVSLIFYAWGEPIFVLVLIGSIFVNYGLGLAVDKYRGDKKKARLVLVVTCIFNIGLLVAYKYIGFVAENVGLLLGFVDTSFADIILPLGISFFTFQAMSYVFDVHRNDAKVERNPFYVALYISFFPQLVAGPIVRYTDIATQIRSRKVTVDGFSKGVCRFVMGLAKKVLISNIMATMADHVFNLSAMSNDLTNVPVSLAWLGVVAYTLQIYFDFSGYSDMAIGLAHLFGFKLKENFNYPYIATSIVDFWRRWHISLSTWFREYVYIPLGGSRVENNDKMVRNTFVVWLLTGIWHGAEWTFILWGMWYFLFIIFERAVNFGTRTIPKVMRHIYVLLVVMIGWVLFRAEDLYQFSLYIGNMFGLNHNGFFSDTAVMFLREYWVFLALGIIFSTPLAVKLSGMVQQNAMGKAGKVLSVGYPFLVLGIFFVSVVYIVKGTYNPFIYFNF